MEGFSEEELGMIQGVHDINNDTTIDPYEALEIYEFMMGNFY